MVKKSKTPVIALLIGALGVVFGDIGTSPLYVMKVVFGSHGENLEISKLSVIGVLSLVIWTVTIVVSFKYVGLIMKADNNGEGGIMALVARLKNQRYRKRTASVLVFLGLVGVALFYGDSAITPAISVLSAVEGIGVVHSGLTRFVIPVTIVVLLGLFWIQRYGTALIGKLFGPVMLVWFAVIAAGGIWQIIQYPLVLSALSPILALKFAIEMPLEAFVAMSAVVLAITGAEALFADMGHFGRKPISRAWFFMVFPCLMACYLGQGSVLLMHHSSAENPFFYLFPAILHIPIVILATLATLIASQSVISGAFSLTRQAVQLGFLPKLTVHHTSDSETGQIYVPLVNALLCVAVILFVVTFGSSIKLAGAYGIAVSGAIVMDTILFFSVIGGLWKVPRAAAILLAVVLLAFDLLLVEANIPKVLHGGWLPLLVACVVLLVIDTWRRGERTIGVERRRQEGPLQDFIANLHHNKFGKVVRVPGQAVYIGHHPGLAPLALHATVENLHELHSKVVIVYVEMTDFPHIHEKDRATFDNLKYADGISQVTLRFGYHDTPNVPRTLETLRKLSPELDFDPHTASYFISLTKAVPTKQRTMPAWRKSLYTLIERNSVSSSNYYKLPFDHTTEMRTLLQL